MGGISVSIVVPCYNEGAFLKKAFKELTKTMGAMHYSYEIILIDDKSSDNTAETIKRLAESSSVTRAYFHKKNQGRGATVKDGFRKARGRIVGFIDIDLEVHCRYIPSMVQAITNGYDGATAWRYYHFNLKSLHRSILSRGYHFLERAMLGLPYHDTEAGFKFFERKKILPLIKKSADNHWFFDTEIMALCHYHGLRIREIPVVFEQNPDSTSTLRLFHDTAEYFKALFAFRKKLRQAGFI